MDRGRTSTRDRSGAKNCMNGARAFFDTNVLLYLYSDASPDKQRKARELYRQQASAGLILVSTQVVQEFYAAATRKLAMPRPTVRTLTDALLELPLVIVTPAHILSAMDNEERYRISFWDGLILAAAEAGGAGVLYTEDLNDGQQYGRVQARNPFRL
jgi:predicted nucleic acid-binding protein